MHWIQSYFQYTQATPHQLVHVTCVISSQSSLLDPHNHPHWSLFSNHQLTPVSRSQTALSGMPHFTCGINFLLLFVFFISSILHHHPALLYRHTLILDHLLTFLIVFSILILKLSFSQSLSLHSRLSFPQADLEPWPFVFWQPLGLVVLVSVAD